MSDEDNNSTIGWEYIATQAAAIQKLTKISESDSVFRLHERIGAIDQCIEEIGKTIHSMKLMDGLEAGPGWRKR